MKPRYKAKRTYVYRVRSDLRKLTAAQARTVRRLAANGNGRQRIAARFGMTRSAIDKIIERKTYREVNP